MQHVYKQKLSKAKRCIYVYDSSIIILPPTTNTKEHYKISTHLRKNSRKLLQNAVLFLVERSTQLNKDSHPPHHLNRASLLYWGWGD